MACFCLHTATLAVCPLAVKGKRNIKSDCIAAEGSISDVYSNCIASYVYMAISQTESSNEARSLECY